MSTPHLIETGAIPPLDPWFDENGEPMHQCNECGLWIWSGNELCESCWKEQDNKEWWEARHPELRCPPRE